MKRNYILTIKAIFLLVLRQNSSKMFFSNTNCQMSELLKGEQPVNSFEHSFSTSQPALENSAKRFQYVTTTSQLTLGTATGMSTVHVI